MYEYHGPRKTSSNKHFEMYASWSSDAPAKELFELSRSQPFCFDIGRPFAFQVCYITFCRHAKNEMLQVDMVMVWHALVFAEKQMATGPHLPEIGHPWTCSPCFTTPKVLIKSCREYFYAFSIPSMVPFTANLWPVLPLTLALSRTKIMG